MVVCTLSTMHSPDPLPHHPCMHTSCDPFIDPSFEPSHSQPLRLKALEFSIVGNMPVANQERRAEVDTRLDNLEQHCGRLDWALGGLKRKVDALGKSTSLILEGFPSVEQEWQSKVATAEVKQWRELKTSVPEAVVKDVCAHLNLAFPLPPDLDSPVAQLVRKLGEALGSQGVVNNIYEQTLWNEATQTRVHKAEAFTVQVTFGLESLQLQQVLQQLDKHLRRASGLKVDGVEPMAVDGQTRRLIYIEKTATEKAKGKNKGKGKGKDGGGNGAPVPAQGAGADGAAAAEAPAQGKGGKGGKAKGAPGKGKGKGKKGRGKAAGK